MDVCQNCEFDGLDKDGGGPVYICCQCHTFGLWLLNSACSVCGHYVQSNSTAQRGRDYPCIDMPEQQAEPLDASLVRFDSTTQIVGDIRQQEKIDAQY
jgi:hypothetical protein